MLVLEVVEVRRVTVGAGRFGCNLTFDAVLAVVMAAAHHLHRLSQHLRAQPTRQLWRHLADKVKGVAIVL